MEEVKIGDQIWMGRNLDVSNFGNGDPIPYAETDEEWLEASIYGEPAWCYFDNDPDIGKELGKLYNWYAVNDPRGIAPEGWHVPSDEEWRKLADHLGGEVGTKMNSTGGWEDDDYNFINENFFLSLPGGYRYNDGTFYNILLGYWWSSPENYALIIWGRALFYNGGDVGRGRYGKGHGFSVRCLKD
jgi:uncharacterized protein (TIGR02145 family)